MLHYKQLYQELGNLFYAVAKADGKITEKEKDTVIELVQHNWRPLENTVDQFNTDAADFIQFQFDVLEDKIVNEENAFMAFANYYKENSLDFDESLKEKILNSARRIAESSRNINDKELKIIMRLRGLLSH